ncbi:MAG: hypothetical protein ACXVRH_16480 [Thermoleophilaceae bacterium]
MLARRLGRERAREIASSASLEAALAALGGSAYGARRRPGMDLAEAQRAVADTALWHLRVLAGWAPPAGVASIRALAAWYELANIEDRLLFLSGGEPATPFELGALATAWPEIAEARSPGEIRARLASSAWGDPLGDDPAEVRLALRLAWARRVEDSVDDAYDLAAGGAALVAARELLLAGRSPTSFDGLPAAGLGGGWQQAGSVGALREALPAHAAWVLEGVGEPGDLWRAEIAWWRRADGVAEELAHAPLMGEPMVVGCVIALGVDAWRVAAALEVAARGGAGGPLELFDELG